MYEVIVKVNFFQLGYPIDLAPYIEKTIFPPQLNYKNLGELLFFLPQMYILM